MDGPGKRSCRGMVGATLVVARGVGGGDPAMMVVLYTHKYDSEAIHENTSQQHLSSI